MTPGSVAMLLGETTGLRVQTTAPFDRRCQRPHPGPARALHAAAVRRAAALRADGGSLSLLQVPPLDLGQVEIVKGAASALYGPSALGGVVNLVSQAPGERQRQGLVNASTQQACDATPGWSSRRAAQGRVAARGFHGRNARTRRGRLVRPALLRTRACCARACCGTTAPAARCSRPRAGWPRTASGGNRARALAPDGLPFAQDLDSRQGDLGLVGRMAFGRGLLLSVRGSFSWRRERPQARRRASSAASARPASARRCSAAARDVTRGWRGPRCRADGYDTRDLERFDYGHRRRGVFAQDELRLGSRVVLGVSARFDHPDELRQLREPAASLLLRPAPGWTVRARRRQRLLHAHPFLEENDESGLARLLPLAAGLVAERARSASSTWDGYEGGFEVNATLFGSRVEDALQRREAVPGALRSSTPSCRYADWGTELLVRVPRGGLTPLATHAYTSPSEEDPEAPGDRRNVPLTPRHVASFNAIWEAEARGRSGSRRTTSGRQPHGREPVPRGARPTC